MAQNTDPEVVSVEDATVVAPVEAEATRNFGGFATAPPLPGALFSYSTSYIVPERDIVASSAGLVVTSYTFDASTYSNDSNGDKICYEGTVLSATSGGKCQARTGSDTAIGVLRRRINLRDGDIDVGMIVGGHLVRGRLWDDTTHGAVDAGAEGDLNAIGVFLHDFQA